MVSVLTITSEKMALLDDFGNSIVAELSILCLENIASSEVYLEEFAVMYEYG